MNNYISQKQIISQLVGEVEKNNEHFSYLYICPFYLHKEKSVINADNG
jgi:hypothetical protein